MKYPYLILKLGDKVALHDCFQTVKFDSEKEVLVFEKYYSSKAPHPIRIYIPSPRLGDVTAYLGVVKRLYTLHPPFISPEVTYHTFVKIRVWGKTTTYKDDMKDIIVNVLLDSYKEAWIPLKYIKKC